jgi:cyclopropane-fatty-acyl-phospholipid synthase
MTSLTVAAGAARDLIQPIQAGANAPGRWTAFVRRRVLDQLGRIGRGDRLMIQETFPGGMSTSLGSDAAPGGLAAGFQVHDPRFYTKIAFGGSVGAAEGYMDGLWSTEDPAELVRVLVRNQEVLGRLNGGSARLMRLLRTVSNLRFRNTREGSKRNIHAHYDLGNRFFETFLDPSMTYSSGVFEDEATTLAEAQTAKLDRLCRKLRLDAGDHLLEIGTGWGSMAMHAAARYGCKVTTTTISAEQFTLATERVKKAGLSDRVQVILEDYRDLRGTYDKLVSVEMIEAVGAAHLDTYLRVIGERLAPHGAAAIQAITIHDPDYKRAARNVDFIKRYVFPGCFIPSTTAILESATRTSDLRLRHAEDLGPHYAKTLRIWRERFVERESDIEAMGYDPRFRRLWEWYLAYCEGGFEERYLGVQQLLFTKPANRDDVVLGATWSL